MSSDSKMCYWRQLWKLTSGFTPSDLVSEKLQNAKEQLELGLSFYKPSTSESFHSFSSSNKLEDKTLRILEKLHQYMDVECQQSWDLFCNYLTYQYHGTPDVALKNFTFVDVRIGELLLEIWKFYNSERNFMLKQLKLILEYKDTNHLYKKEFNSIVNGISLAKLKTSLLKQFEYLVKETPPSKIKNGDNVTHQMQLLWMERNLKEQLEILQLILLVFNEDTCTVTEFKQLFSLFKMHSFGRQPVYARHLLESHHQVILKIVYAEVALFYKFVCDAQRVVVNSVVKAIKNDVETELVRLQHRNEHGALLLAWLLLLVQDPQDGDVLLSKYQHFGVKALQLKVFQFLYEMITHPMFSDKSKYSLITRSSVHQILELLCEKFDATKFIGVHSDMVELCSELLKEEKTACEFWKNVNLSEPVGLGCLWNVALEFFPFDSKTLSLIIQGVSKAGSNNLQILLKELEDLPIFTEAYRPGMVGLANLGEELILTEDYLPYNNNHFIIRKQSMAVIVDRKNVTLIHFRSPMSYWNVLQQEMQSLLDDNGSRCTNINIMEKLEDILYGIQALSSVLQALSFEDKLPEYLIEPCEVVFEVLVKFAYLPVPPMPLIGACLNVLTALVPSFTQRLYWRFINIKLLPSVEITNLGYEDYVKGVSYQSGLLGMYLMNIEQQSGEYISLNAYMDLLLAFYENNIDRDITMGVLLPGLIFILKDIFPHMLLWFYKTSTIKYSLIHKCVSFLQKISQLSPEQTTRPADLLLNKVCIYSLLNSENGSTLLTLISAGEQAIQNFMENESNWLHGLGIEYIKIIQLSMAILMQILRLKSIVNNKASMCPLEVLIYTEPRQKDALKIIPTVVGYINHVFNINLPNTACRLLRRFALDFQMSLLTCLDMSPHQIRIMFLERLRDKSESNSLKTVILEFVASCVEKQPGLTEAFFKASHLENEIKVFETDKDSNVGTTDGILTYMAEFLAVVKKDTNSLYNPLLSRMMELFHALWKTNMQILVKDLRENRDFWEYLCSPLFHDILPDIRAYSQILNILAIELFLFHGKVDKSLKTAIDKIFNTNTTHLQKWLNFIFSFEGKQSMKIIDEVPTWLSLLTSWKDFISILIKFSPSPIPLSNKLMMVDTCLKTLCKELECRDDGRTIVILSEMYVIYFSNWREDCIEDKEKYMNIIADLLKHSAAGFEELHPRAKVSIMSICTLSLNIVNYKFRSEKVLSYNIVCSVCDMMASELKRTEESMDKLDGQDITKTNTEKPDLNPLVLVLRLLEQCVNIFKNDIIGWDIPFMSYRIINKIVNFVSMSARKRNMLKQTVAAFNCLTSFARSSLSDELMYCDISQNLWLKLIPPKELIQSNTRPTDCTWQTNEWLQVYKNAIDFVTAMLENHCSFFAADAILFVGVQEDYLNESILLIRQTLDMDALNLTSSTLYFISELVKYETRWRQEHFQSMVTIMRSIGVCFHYCVTMILRPKGVHFSIESPSTMLTQDETDNTGPSAKVTSTLNKLLELIHLCAVCLKAFSPDLLSLLADSNPDISKWQPLMELQFCAPKLSDEPFPQLTFGTVLSAVCFLVRSLNHNYHSEEVPLNNVRKTSGRKNSSRRKISVGLGEERVERRRTLRSDSVTGVSSTTTTSTVTIGSSWLAALDKKLVLVTLENVLTLLASQALFASKDNSMSARDKQLIRRELCTELPIYHEFVRKRVLDISHPRNHLCRKKFGCYQLMRNDEESKLLSASQENREMSMDTSAPTPPLRLPLQDSMRVSVVRKLHLDKAKTKLDSSSTPKKYIPSNPLASQFMGATSTPVGTSALKVSSSHISKHVTWEDSIVTEEESEQLLEPTEPHYSPLSDVQMIEEDYLHFLSNLFLHFSQTEL